ncbi:lipoprotein insertase outer membrane protein LolB [Neisseria oralis]|uniref:lipoprotein insertase outer membrane protein LolB n=1 Tax=Neisseria oralis TaxID=1107316 RepID=UPI0027E16E50|nr:lipoprotein insertase outer membrane protein LolB [Neisseria oralis]
MSAAAVTVLAACSQPKLPEQADWSESVQVPDFTADGRLSVKVEEKGSYANFDWTYQNQVQTISINTPLGSTLGQLCQDGEGVLAVDSKGKKYQAPTAEELSGRLLGYNLPVQYLHIWANGKRVAGAPYQIDSEGRLQQFQWTISRTLKSDGKPRVLLLESPKLTLRLVFDEMNFTKDASAPKQCAARFR